MSRAHINRVDLPLLCAVLTTPRFMATTAERRGDKERKTDDSLEASFCYGIYLDPASVNGLRIWTSLPSLLHARFGAGKQLLGIFTGPMDFRSAKAFLNCLGLRRVGSSKQFLEIKLSFFSLMKPSSNRASCTDFPVREVFWANNKGYMQVVDIVCCMLTPAGCRSMSGQTHAAGYITSTRARYCHLSPYTERLSEDTITI